MTAPVAQQRQPAPARGSGISAAQLAELLVLVQAQAAVRHRLSQTAVAAVRNLFAGFAGWWWDTARVNRAITTAVRVIQPIQRQAARTTDAYLTRAASVMTGQPVKTVGVIDVTRLRPAIPADVARQLIDGALRPAFLELGDTHDGPGRDINAPARLVLPDNRPPVRPGEQYARVLEQYRYQTVATPTAPEKAAGKAMLRLETAAQTDVTLAVREQVRHTLGPIEGVTGYRRILHPELSKTGPCGLCVVAADRVYHKADLLPLHDRCVCETLPVIGSMDPGISLNADDLAKVYAAAGGTGGEVIKGGRHYSGRLKKLRVALAEHGELGPVLVDAAQQFRGPRQVAEIIGPDPRVSARAQLAALEKQLDLLRRTAETGQDVQQPIGWHTRRIDQLRHELGLPV